MLRTFCTKNILESIISLIKKRLKLVFQKFIVFFAAAPDSQ